MLVTLSGIVTLVRPLQPLNAQSPMLVTLSGIVTPVSPLQSKNAWSPMRVTMCVTLRPSIAEGIAMSPSAGETPVIVAAP